MRRESNPLVLGRRRGEDFRHIKDQVMSRMEGWMSKCLSRAGRTTLIKLVVQSIPSYAMAAYKLPNSFCSDLDSLVRRFWWSGDVHKARTLALKSWDSLCQPKMHGGLGFKRFKAFNDAFLAKLSWKVAAKENTLWVRVLVSNVEGHSPIYRNSCLIIGREGDVSISAKPSCFPIPVPAFKRHASASEKVSKLLNFSTHLE